ncbi:MAG: penicillin-binding transpeptidase domain-containing protein, partial [Candidatus Liptonbacteria bacterium]|nr:penicillin-binding transpeptidase domain-containing protein [Candidatus Liptonbacteria bacterium]
AVLDGATQNEKLYGGKNAALVAEDPTTGQILALVGSRDYFDIKNEGNFNVAMQGLRQPGSSLKPFIYLTAFQKGYTPDTVLFDVPTEFAANNPSCPPVPNFSNNNKQCFHPQDFEESFAGPVNLRTALAQSINIPAVKTLYLAGLRDSVTNAYNFGLTSLTSPDLYGLSLVLGGGAVRLIDLAGAYSVLAADGIKHDQSEVLEVRNAKGSVLESWKDNATPVADAESVRLVNNILSDSDARSALFQNSLGLTVFPGFDVALKTGTSDDYRDAWTSGYTPSLAVSVWAGNNDNTPLQKHGSSILAAVPIWHAFMSKVIQKFPATTFNRPDPVSPQKPILAGDYLHNKEIHTILHYINKSDPTGPSPADPTSDPQFTNWETGVLDWARQNLPNFQEYNQAFSAGTQTSAPSGPAISAPPPRVKIQFPAAGAFFNNTLRIYATISGDVPLTRVKTFWNASLVQDIPLPVPQKNYNYEWQFTPQSAAPQNLLEVEVFDQSGNSGKSGVIVYSQ